MCLSGNFVCAYFTHEKTKPFLGKEPEMIFVVSFVELKLELKL